MSEFAILRTLLFAAECILASALLPLLGFAVTMPMRRRAALRHLVWTTMFGVLAMLPFVALLLPARQVINSAAAPVTAPPPAVMDAVIAAPAPMPPPESLLTPGNIVLLLLAVWLVGLVFQALRLGLGGWGLLRLRRRSAPFASEIATRCAVRLAQGEAGPSTFGILRPVVLLPRSAAGWPSARLEAVLRHEAAHVRRRDVAAQFIARLVCGLYWFNPLLWLAASAQRRDAEIAADDEVLAGGMTPSLYAAELVGLAAEVRGVSPGVAMAGPPLSQRVQAVLSVDSSRKGVSRMDMAKTVTFGLAATLLLGVARLDLAVAQDAPPARPAPRANAATEAQPRVEVRKQVNVNVERQVNTEVQKAIEAQAAAVKAQADVSAGLARARLAEAEKDPATAAARLSDLRENAARAAADAAVTKANADLTVAQARAAARARAEADARPARVITEARDRLSADRARLEQTQQRLAQARERAGADGQRAREEFFLQTTERNGLQTDFGLSFQPPPMEFDTANAAIAEAIQRPEVRRAIDEAVTVAMAEARKAIRNAIAKAVAEAGAVSPVPPAPRAMPIPPAPPVPPAPN